MPDAARKGSIVVLVVVAWVVDMAMMMLKCHQFGGLGRGRKQSAGKQLNVILSKGWQQSVTMGRKR